VFKKVIDFINQFETDDEFEKARNKINNEGMTHDIIETIEAVGDFKIEYLSKKYGNRNGNWNVSIYYRNVWIASITLRSFQCIIEGHYFKVSYTKMDDVIDKLTASIPMNTKYNSERINKIDTFSYFRSVFYSECLLKSKYPIWNH
jgi:hypothetical protein